MTCKDIKDVVEEYGTVIELVKAICTDRVCTLDAIQKNLKTKNVEIGEAALLAVIAQIEGMITFTKEDTYDIGDVVTYRRYWIWGRIARDETIGNTIVIIKYKKFYLYNDRRFTDDAFREHIFSKLEFEELKRTVVDNADGLQKALDCLRIEKDKWTNYVFVDDEYQVHCKKWNKSLGCSTKENLGKSIRRTPSK